MQVLVDVQQTAIDRSVKLLAAMGCEFKIIAPDGAEYGELLVQPKLTKAPRNKFKQTGYIEQITQINLGETISFTPPEGTTAEDYRGAISGCITRVHGLGSGITSIQDGIVQLIRIQ